MTNKITFNPTTGDLTARNCVQATKDHQCDCGTKFTITLDWPENVTANSQITLNNAVCPTCRAPVVLPTASYYVENFRLLSKPLPLSSKPDA